MWVNGCADDATNVTTGRWLATQAIVIFGRFWSFGENSGAATDPRGSLTSIVP